MNVRINAALDLFSLSVGAVSRRPRLSQDRSTTLTAVKTPGGFVHLDPASGAFAAVPISSFCGNDFGWPADPGYDIK